MPGNSRPCSARNIFKNANLLVAEATFAVGRYQVEEPSFHPYTSKFDYWLEGKARFSDGEMRGYRLFNDQEKANCAGCHNSQPSRDGFPPLFTDTQYEALAAPRNMALADTKDPNYFDLGVCGPIRKDVADQTQFCGMFKTPTLRNTAVRHAFFHNGVFQTLQQVMDFYNFRDTNPEKIYPLGGRREGPEVQRYSGAVSRQCRCQRSPLQPAPRRNAGHDCAGRGRHHRVPANPERRIQTGEVRPAAPRRLNGRDPLPRGATVLGGAVSACVFRRSGFED